MRLASAGHATVLDGVFQEEDRRQCVASIGVIHQDRTLTHDLLILLADQADHGFKQRMARADEGGDRLLVDLVLLEANPLVLCLERRAGPDLAIPFDEISDSEALPSDLDSPLAIYCKSGNMSADAVDDLVALGYTDVVELDGGFDAWVEAGRRLDS